MFSISSRQPLQHRSTRPTSPPYPAPQICYLRQAPRRRQTHWRATCSSCFLGFLGGGGFCFRRAASRGICASAVTTTTPRPACQCLVLPVGATHHVAAVPSNPAAFVNPRPLDPLASDLRLSPPPALASWRTCVSLGPPDRSLPALPQVECLHPASRPTAASRFSMRYRSAISSVVRPSSLVSPCAMHGSEGRFETSQPSTISPY
jgi:hypothetical protein